MSSVILSKNSYSQLPLMQSLASRVLSEKTFYIFQCFSCIISDTSSYSLLIYFYIFNSYSSLYSILKQHVTTLAFCFVLHLCRTSLFRSVAPLSQKISSSFFGSPAPLRSFKFFENQSAFKRSLVLLSDLLLCE